LTAPLKGLSAKGIEFSNFILRCIREGYSATRTLRELREVFGTAYRMTDFYRDFRILSVAEKDWSVMERIPKHELIRREYYKEANLSPEHVMITKARCTFRTSWGEIKEVYVSVSHDRLITREELEHLVEYYATKYNEELISAVPVQGMIRAGLL